MNKVSPKRNSSASDRLREHSATVAEDLRELGQLTGEAAREKLTLAQDTAASVYRKGREKVREGTRSVGTYVQERPVHSLLMAAGAGAVLGFVLARRNRATDGVDS